MIYIKRTKPRLMGAFRESLFYAEAKIKQFYKKPASLRRQQKVPFDAEILYLFMESIRKEFSQKCAYCERDILKFPGVLDNFRPRSGVKDGEQFLPEHYGWLAYQWENIYLACEDCARFKFSYFPVKGKRAKPGVPYKEVVEENNLLIDPCLDNPIEHLRFEENGEVQPLSEKGDITIEIFRLNRKELIESRSKAIKSYNTYLDIAFSLDEKDNGFAKGLTLFYALIADKSEYPHAGAVQEFIKRKLLHNPEILERLEKHKPKNFRSRFLSITMRNAIKEVEAQQQAELEYDIESRSSQFQFAQLQQLQRDKIFLKSITIKNFRGISYLVFDFPSPNINQVASGLIEGEPWTMLLGENGVGKSSFLQAIALGLMGRKSIRALRIKSDDILNKNASSGFIKIHYHGADIPLIVTFSKGSIVKTKNVQPSGNILAYGASRMQSNKLKDDFPDDIGQAHVRNLFAPTTPLTDAHQWIVQLFKQSKKSTGNRALFDWLGLAIKDLLLLERKAKLIVKKNKVVIQHTTKRAEYFGDLSDGYKSVITVAIDMMRTLLKDKTTIESSQGIVLLDEIGTHLHPRWRMQVVHRLRKVFPRLQFIVTTHDPLCLRGLKKGEISVFFKSPRNKVKVITDLPDPAGFNAEQLLSSQFFGLNSTYDWEDEAKFDEYHLLLSKKRLNVNQKERLKILRDFVFEYQQIGDSKYERIFNTVIHQSLADSKFITPVSEVIISEKVFKKVQNLLS